MAPELEANTGEYSKEVSDRRKSYRAKVQGSLVRVRIWRIAPGVPLSQQPMPSKEIRVVVNDICLTGLGITLLGENIDPPIAPTDRLRIEITHGENIALVEGKLRTAEVELDGCYIRGGIRFDGNESNFGFHIARSAMAKIMGLVQREELKARRNAEERGKS